MSTNTTTPRTTRTATCPGPYAIGNVVLRPIVEAGGVARIASRSGTGRDFLNHFIHRHPTMAGRDHHWLDYNNAPDLATSKAVSLRLATTLGLNPDPRASEHVLVQTLVTTIEDRVANRPLVMCVDGAEHMSADGLRTLRYIHDRTGAGLHGRPPRMALLFVTGAVRGVGATGPLSFSNGVSSVVVD